jgi:molybdate transport system regulatory protein
MTRKPYKVGASVVVYHENKIFIGPEQFALIRQILDDGSMNAAASHLGFSFQKTWQMVTKMNALSDQPIIIVKRGGNNGGGCFVSEYGKKILNMYARRELEVIKALAQSENELDSQLF